MDTLTTPPIKGYPERVANVTLAGYRCDRCGHEWVPRDKLKEPLVCPKCKSAYWNTPRKAPKQ